MVRKPAYWVIAETTGLPTRFAKIYVTDEAGRYVIPDLPQATYEVWSRGYGSPTPADRRHNRAPPSTAAVPAPTAADAAQRYPAIYWFSLLHVPRTTEFPLEKSGAR
jgi:hypothetical protein